MKMMPYGVAAALLVGGSLMAPPAKAWQSGADSQSSSAQPADDQTTASPSIRDLQQQLKQEGFYRGAIDGVWGQESRSAMQAYQKQRGLSASGQLDRDTLQAMRSKADSMSRSGGDSAIQSGSSGGDDSSRSIGVGGAPSRAIGGGPVSSDSGSSDAER